MERDSQRETTGRIVPPSFETAEGKEQEDIPAWEPVGDGYWLPQRVRGSNRGRALG